MIDNDIFQWSIFIRQTLGIKSQVGDWQMKGASGTSAADGLKIRKQDVL